MRVVNADTREREITTIAPATLTPATKERAIRLMSHAGECAYWSRNTTLREFWVELHDALDVALATENELLASLLVKRHKDVA